MAKRKDGPEEGAVGATAFVPVTRSLAGLERAAAGCRGCELYRNATRVVFGEGRRGAEVMLVGEQPGDVEDREGRPFVGPSGKLLRRAWEEAGLDPARTYVTNAVKHFYWERSGARRLHKSPKPIHIHSCKPWLLAEVEAVRPGVLVCLGSTAARAVFGKPVTLAKLRGEPHVSSLCPRTFVTLHPSALLRIPASGARREAFHQYVEDFRRVVKELKRALAA